ncbi:MAG: hypothetical protein GX638_08710, partial [Crenarchaeota archaeon]|nr:hypothetical protein [Thermoproteota archaeon]
ENVKTGIQFSTEGPETIGDTTNPGDSAAFTIIDDVGIELKNDANAVGIKVGADNSTHLIKPYSSYIKSNVWMKSAGGTGLKINNGELKHGTINLAVQGPTDGIGINLGSGNERVYKNQFTNLTKNPIEKGCLLSTGGIPIENRIIPTYPMPTNDIKVKAY